MRPTPADKAELLTAILGCFGGLESIMRGSEKDKQTLLDFLNLPTTEGEQMSKLEQAKDAILDRIMDKDVLPSYVKILAEAYAHLSESARMDKSFEYQTSHTPIDMLAKLKAMANDAEFEDDIIKE